MKLRYLEELDSSKNLSDTSSLILKIIIDISNLRLLENLRRKNLYDRSNQPLCFNFDISIMAIEEKEAV